jgi:D-inositol-3-phosphate glycosyltransferase
MNNRWTSLNVALLTGGIDKSYASGLSTCLASAGITLDVICNSEMDTEEMRVHRGLRLLTLYRTPSAGRGVVRRLLACLLVYARLIRYALTCSAQVFHILWNYKLALFDRTVLLLYYKLLGKRLVFTAHNVNAAERDGSDSVLNRWSLRLQYRLVDHIFVHTDQMKSQLVERFAVPGTKVTIIPFGIYDMVPQTSITPAESRQRLGLRGTDRTLLFFGRIVPYKGLDLLVDAFGRLAVQKLDYRLLIAGEPMKEAEQHWRQVRQTIEQSSMRDQVTQHIRHIPDDEIELYFKAADALVLPYRHIFQSGVLFMAYSFGLPVIATDVGSFRQDIIPGTTGVICQSDDPQDLARAIETYFASELFEHLDQRRIGIQNLIHADHSWEIVASRTAEVYGKFAGCQPVQLRA